MLGRPVVVVDGRMDGDEDRRRGPVGRATMDPMESGPRKRRHGEWVSWWKCVTSHRGVVEMAVLLCGFSWRGGREDGGF